jgi:hypothetical protein
MPISPSDLPWWGWLLIAAGVWIFGMFLANWAEEKLDVPAPWIVIPFSLGAGLTAVIGIIRFVRWIWAG